MEQVLAELRMIYMSLEMGNDLGVKMYFDEDMVMKKIDELKRLIKEEHEKNILVHETTVDDWLND
jgi:hypothetical protein